VSATRATSGPGADHDGRMSDPAPSVVTVPGSGTASAPPDAMHVRLAASTLRATLAAALADSERAAARLREVFAAAGVTGPDAATTGLAVHAEQEWAEGRGARVTGYRSEHQLLVVLRDLAAAGRLLGDALVSGGDDVRLDGVSFVVEDDRPLRDRARDAAWQDARARAEQLAGLAGRTLGDVVTVCEGSAVVPFEPMPRMRAMAADAAGVAVQPGGVDVVITLTVQWRLA
jgi:uncharacterized protein